jgi:enoyl-CoA hydratase/carnithine racemase
VELTARGPVHVLQLDEPDQVLNDRTVADIGRALDEVEAGQGPAALVLTGVGRSFHQGLDLPFLLGLGEGSTAFIRTVHQLFGRLLRMDLPTVAAINGHAQAGGAMLATCADLRIMRADRGWFRLPEVELGLPFTIVMNDLLAARLPQPARHRAMVLGERMGGAEAAAAGVVDLAVDGEGAALEVALVRAEELAVHRGPVLAAIRRSLYADLLAAIDADADRDDLFTR